MILPLNVSKEVTMNDSLVWNRDKTFEQLYKEHEEINKRNTNLYKYIVYPSINISTSVY